MLAHVRANAIARSRVDEVLRQEKRSCDAGGIRRGMRIPGRDFVDLVRLDDLVHPAGDLAGAVTEARSDGGKVGQVLDVFGYARQRKTMSQCSRSRVRARRFKCKEIV